MMTEIAILLLISFTLGMSIGLQQQRIVKKLYATVRRLEESQAKLVRKNTGVVRPNDSYAPPTEDLNGKRSAVIRPKMPNRDSDENEIALASVRERVGIQ